MQLENEAGFYTGSLSRIEKDEIVPTTDTRLRISKALDLDIKEAEYLMELNFYLEKHSKLDKKIGKQNNKKTNDQKRLKYR